MTPSFEALSRVLKKLPGLGARSADRIALNLLVEDPSRTSDLIQTLQNASKNVRACETCGNVAESPSCGICSNPARSLSRTLCIVERVSDLHAIERSGSYTGSYHVLHGKLSPIKGINPEDLNLTSLKSRLKSDLFDEIILALGGDIEGEATCHYIQSEIIADSPLKVTRIGFGLPSGSGVVFADPATLKRALEGRRSIS